MQSDIADLSTPRDIAMQPAAGCRSGVGYKVGKGFACPGLHDSAALASQLCADGYVIPSGAAGLDLAGCKTLPGFYIAESTLRRYTADTDPNNFVCSQPPQIGQNRLFSGCGSSAWSGAFTLKGPCQGFLQALDCKTSAGFSCSGSSVDMTDNTDPAAGVICIN
jgi:hypothetical protein